MTDQNLPPRAGWEIDGYLSIKNNRLQISGADAVTLANEYDTPLFVVSAPRVRSNIARLMEVAHCHSRLKLCYASKANNLLGVLWLVHQSGIDVEVNSGGELFRALKAGFRPEQIEMNGVAKSRAEISEAIDAGIYAINVDSPYELELIEETAAALGKRARITLRLVAGVGTRSHAGLQTALYTSQFGISPMQARDVLVRALSRPECVELVGIHIHVGSQTPDIEPYAEAFSRMWEHVLWLYRETGHRLKHINIGGGIPVNYLRDQAQSVEIREPERVMLEADLSPAALIGATVELIRGTAKQAGAEDLFDELEIVLEPGRSIIADACTILTRVRNLKHRPETRQDWLLTDAGYNLMLSMVMYHWYYQAVDATRAGEPHDTRYRVAGPLCDGGDVYFDLHGEGRLPDYRMFPRAVGAGEVIAMLNTGAYTMSQMTAYNGRPLPAAVMIDDNGHVELIRRRDSYDDLLNNEL